MEFEIFSSLMPYEAAHVGCVNARPICPVCGAEQPPGENSWLKRIIDENPK